MPDRKDLVLIGSYRECQRWCHEKQINIRTTTVITHPDSLYRLHGMRDVDVCYLHGAYSGWCTQSIVELHDQLRWCNATQRNPDEYV